MAVAPVMLASGGVLVLAGLLLGACGGKGEEPAADEGAAGPSGAGGEGGAGGSKGGAGMVGMPGTGAVGMVCDESGDGCSAPHYETPEGNGVPPKPSADAPMGDGAANSVVAVRKLFLGDTDRDGKANADAWKQYGFDLDGVTSTVDYKGHCKAIGGGKKAEIRVDGNDG